ncbi:hypothetical protein CEXT_812751 [Caerostris extrusa]|uniref:Uncharacterized protein n=1 Tax=Caerostris extrusa TaxID=172846 RepID=A0AAV4NGL9_CAEEX|nr:hypothetical protein CEXT_812751 [Caerostris extrusa]
MNGLLVVLSIFALLCSTVSAGGQLLYKPLAYSTYRSYSAYKGTPYVAAAPIAAAPVAAAPVATAAVAAPVAAVASYNVAPAAVASYNYNVAPAAVAAYNYNVAPVAVTSYNAAPVAAVTSYNAAPVAAVASYPAAQDIQPMGILIMDPTWDTTSDPSRNKMELDAVSPLGLKVTLPLRISALMKSVILHVACIEHSLCLNL